jgi:hypothetical protein
MSGRHWYQSLRDHWHVVAYTLLLLVTVVIYVLHFLSPALGEKLEPFLEPTNLLVIILIFVAVIAAKLNSDSEQFSSQIKEMREQFAAQLGEVKSGLLSESQLASTINSQITPLTNARFYRTKDETFTKLAGMTARSQQVLMATRFSPGDITLDAEYWSAVTEKAFDPDVLSIRIHSLAHRSSRPVEVLCKVVDQFKNAQQFTLGIALFNNAFEMIISDDEECIFCFHDFDMTIRNGIHFDSNLPSSRAIVSNFGETFRRMLDRCYLVIDFDRWVCSEEDVQDLQVFIRRTHEEYGDGTLLERPHRVEDFLRDQVFVHRATGQHDVDGV